jgi:hypothetical protein
MCVVSLIHNRGVLLELFPVREDIGKQCPLFDNRGRELRPKKLFNHFVRL